MSSSSLSSPLRPSRPFPYQQQPDVLNLSALGIQVAHAEQSRQNAYEASRKLQSALIQARTALETSHELLTTDQIEKDATERLEVMLSSTIPIVADRCPREANLSMRIEDVVRHYAFSHFLETGRLLPPSKCRFATDEEYLGGACMGLAADLSRYGMGRATARDVVSVTMARNLVQDVLDELLQFDFRNGPLRRKYDGTKYSLKTLETLLYELSVTGSTIIPTATVDDDEEEEDTEPQTKRSRAESLLPNEELKALRLRMEHRDELRETLIKKCRDAQKAAKQSIFALHRGDRIKAFQLITQCEQSITTELWPIVKEEPPLRSGSFGGVLEEYAEAKLFYTWLFGEEENNTKYPHGDLLSLEQFSIALEPDEYVGGLCDLTGEVGRFAVQRGTARDMDGVKHCLQTNRSILNELQTMERLPGSTGKKMDGLRRSVEKLERMLYEMSLSEATGGRNVAADSTMDPEEGDN